MSAEEQPSTADRIASSAIELFRRKGYVATTVDEICKAAGTSKGSFFHHFAGKEALAEACLERWNRWTRSIDDEAPYHLETDPKLRLTMAMDYYVAFFSRTDVVLSCLAGTVAQEVFESHPNLLAAANRCFCDASGRIETLIRAAAEESAARDDAESLARLWTGTIQGALILAKTSQDASVIGESLRHVKSYIDSRISNKSNPIGNDTNKE